MKFQSAIIPNGQVVNIFEPIEGKGTALIS